MKRTIRKMLALGLVFVLMFSFWTAAYAADSNIFTVQVNVTYGQTEARSMLAAINAFRTGPDTWYWNEDDATKTVLTDLKPLTYDYTLERVAMQRAAEIALSFSHTRPNGDVCFIAYDEAGYAAGTRGENIAAGQTTAAAVFAAWQETDASYSGQGHRRNMLSTEFAAVGIGHVYYNGIHYWVQEFGNSTGANTTAVPAQDTAAGVDVNVASSFITSVAVTTAAQPLNLEIGGSMGLPAVEVQVKLKSTWPGIDCPVAANVDWSVSPAGIVQLHDGVLTGLQSGTANLIAEVCGETIVIPVTVTVTKFTDVPAGEYYAEPVAWAVEQGITTGMTETTFEPDTTCTRGQIVTFLWRAAGEPEPTSTHNPFTDVSSTNYFYKAVLWAVEKGITTGMTATTFAPNGECTRGQAVTFLWRAAGQPAPTSANNPFTDISSTEYYYQAVLWAAENGVTNGVTPTTFVPNKTCTRGQIVTFLYRTEFQI